MLNILKKIISFMVVLFFIGCGKNVDFAKNDFIYDSKNDVFITYQEFLKDIKKYDFVILGEVHDENAHHNIQAKIINDIDKRIVFMEMLDENLNLGKNWSKKDYKIVLDAINKRNLQKGYCNVTYDEVYKRLESGEKVQGEHSTTPKIRARLKELIVNNHDLKDKEDLIELFVDMQQYKDRKMATSLYNSKEKALMIVGNYHANKTIGIPQHLKDLKTQKSSVVVLLETDKKDLQNNKKEYQEAGDYIWVY